MRHAIAIGLCSLAIVSAGAAAQTAAEQKAILGDFQRSVVDYTQQHKCLALFPGALNAATPAPKIFTLPVAMVFRQLIAAAIATGESGVAIRGAVIPRHPAVLQPFPDAEVTDFPKVLSDALPLLPPPLVVP